jgi:hypothetical protein
MELAQKNVRLPITTKCVAPAKAHHAPNVFLFFTETLFTQISIPAIRFTGAGEDVRVNVDQNPMCIVSQDTCVVDIVIISRIRCVHGCMDLKHIGA